MSVDRYIIFVFSVIYEKSRMSKNFSQMETKPYMIHKLFPLPINSRLIIIISESGWIPKAWVKYGRTCI